MICDPSNYASLVFVDSLENRPLHSGSFPFEIDTSKERHVQPPAALLFTFTTTIHLHLLLLQCHLPSSTTVANRVSYNIRGLEYDSYFRNGVAVDQWIRLVWGSHFTILMHVRIFDPNLISFKPNTYSETNI